MLRATVETLMEVTGADLLAGSPAGVVSGLSIDSRTAEPGVVFVAFPGERTDGHAFLNPAIDAGAHALVVTRLGEGVDPAVMRARERGIAVLRVSDALVSLTGIAEWHRSRLGCRVIGITGSTGKTTTKDMLTSILLQSHRVTATVGNRNNEVGVPLTILDADLGTEMLVVEMGMRGTGQIAELARIARPEVALVTNVGVCHVELMKDVASIADAKGELVAALPQSGRAFLNGDDAFSQRIANLSAAPVTTYGLGESCGVRADRIELDAESRASFEVVWSGGRFEAHLSVPGRHNVYNALASAAVALDLGIPPEDVQAGLATAALSAMRMQVLDTARGVTVINDAYNANPVSMRAAVETLASMRVHGRTVAVLGDMAELGSLAELAHFELGEVVAHAEVGTLVTVGERAERIAAGARAASGGHADVRQCRTVEEASEVLDDLLEKGDVVLVKASRVMGLERVVEGIVTPRV